MVKSGFFCHLLAICFPAWLHKKGMDQEFEGLPDETLGPLLKHFYATASTKEGLQYSKASIFGLRAAIQRHLQAPSS